MVPTSPLNLCFNCIKSLGGKPFNPYFAPCDNGGIQNWPTAQSGIPYVNSGNTISGISVIKIPNGSSGTGALTTDGTVLTASANDDSNLTLATLPATVVGDFTASMEIMPFADSPCSIGVVMYDADTKKSFWPTIGIASDLTLTLWLALICDLLAGTFESVIQQQTLSTLNVGSWNTYSFSRRGTLGTLLVNGVAYFLTLKTDVPVNIGILFGMTFESNSFKIRNIAISTP